MSGLGLLPLNLGGLLIGLAGLLAGSPAGRARRPGRVHRDLPKMLIDILKLFFREVLGIGKD